MDRRKPPPKATEPDDLLEKDWAGYCYTACCCWAWFTDGAAWTVVHGSTIDCDTGKQILHGWCEREDVVLDFTQAPEDRLWARDAYYSAYSAEVIHRYSADQVTRMRFRTGNDGPWTEEERERHLD